MKTKKISPAESRVMEVLWQAGRPIAAEEVSDALADEQDWAHGTVRSLLTRLVKKNAAAIEPDGRRYLYRPKIPRDDYVLTESRSFLDRLFDGRMAPFVAHFADREPLTKRDIAELRALIDRLEAGA